MKSDTRLTLVHFGLAPLFLFSSCSDSDAIAEMVSQQEAMDVQRQQHAAGIEAATEGLANLKTELALLEAEHAEVRSRIVERNAVLDEFLSLGKALSAEED